MLFIKYRKSLVFIVPAVIVGGCGFGGNLLQPEATQISSFENAEKCGLILETASGDLAGSQALAPGVVNLNARYVTCGDLAGSEGEKWRAIGASVERNGVNYVAGSLSEKRLAQIRASGEIVLTSLGGEAQRIGTVEVVDYGMPIAIDAGLSVELRAAGVLVDAANLAKVNHDELEIAVVRAN